MARILRRILIAAAVLTALLVVVTAGAFLVLRLGPAGGVPSPFADGRRAENFRTLHEAYYQGYDERALATSFSAAKSFTAALVGSALDRGHIRSIDDAISDYVPELVGSGYQAVAMRDVLTMSSGIAFDEDDARLGSDVMQLPLRLFVLRRPVVDVLGRLPREREHGMR